MNNRISARAVRYSQNTADYYKPAEPDVYAQVRMVRPFRWRWHLTAGPGGPTILGPSHALTEGGAWRAAHRAAWLPKDKR